MHEDQLCVDRRAFLRRAGAGGLLAVAPGLLAACGSDAGGTTSSQGATDADGRVGGRITMMNYPDWIGAGEVAAFTERFPGTTVRQVSGLTSGDGQAIAQVSQNRKAYDLALATATLAGQLRAAELLSPVGVREVPNLAAVPNAFRDPFPYGIPTDYGKIGFAYRKDLIRERPKSWADLWAIAPRYSGKVTFLRFENDAIGVALKLRGLSVNASKPAELTVARDALLAIKPHVRAFVSTDFSKDLIRGSAVLAVDYDYDIAAAQAENDNIVWVAPEEGLPGYVEGWVALAGGRNARTVHAFMDHHLEPTVYADFINTVGSAYVLPAATPKLKRAIRSNPLLAYSPEAVRSVEFQRYISPEATAARARLFEEVLAA